MMTTYFIVANMFYEKIGIAPNATFSYQNVFQRLITQRCILRQQLDLHECDGLSSKCQTLIVQFLEHLISKWAIVVQSCLTSFALFHFD